MEERRLDVNVGVGRAREYYCASVRVDYNSGDNRVSVLSLTPKIHSLKLDFSYNSRLIKELLPNLPIHLKAFLDDSVYPISFIKINRISPLDEEEEKSLEEGLKELLDNPSIEQINFRERKLK